MIIQRRRTLLEAMFVVLVLLGMQSSTSAHILRGSSLSASASHTSALAPRSLQETTNDANETVTSDPADEDTVLDPWEIGTHVYKEFPHGWTFGVIKMYHEATQRYRVKFDNGQFEYFDYTSTDLDQMVENANQYVGYDPGTPVMNNDARRGVVTSFEDWIYTITWEDGSDENPAVETFTNIMEVVAMVQNSKAIDPWEAPTRVRKNFGTSSTPDWHFGTVMSYQVDEDEYQIKYEHGVSETYDYESATLDRLVENASEYIGYEPGTPLRSDEGRRGVITNFENWVYTVNWGRGEPATETFTSMQDVIRMVENELALDPWEPGTHVRKNFGSHHHPEWHFGTVAVYEELKDEYMVQYENGATETYNYASADLDAMVENANQYVGYAVGTPVLHDDGRHGVITSFEDWVYAVKWNDGEVVEEFFTDISEVVAMVENELALDPWEPGTYVRKNFGSIENPDWYFGTVVSYDMEKDQYVIIYENGDSETYNYESSVLDELVHHAEHYVGYDVGTPVMKYFGNDWYFGTIIDFTDWTYTVEWETGDRNEYTSIRLVDALVESAELQSGSLINEDALDSVFDPKTGLPIDAPPHDFGKKFSNGIIDTENNSGMSVGLLIFFILAALTGLAVAVIMVLLRRRQRRVESQNQSALSRSKEMWRRHMIGGEYRDNSHSLHLNIPEMD